MLPAVDYNTQLHRRYDQGRRLSHDAIRAWTAALTHRVPAPRPVRIAELGSGTGRFTSLLATIGRGPGYAIEPSAQMRRVAAQHPCSGVHHVAGRAEAVPLATGSCDALAMFFVAHHITDMPAAAYAIADILRPGGRLLIAGSFSERLHPRAYYHYQPRARDIERQLFPTLKSCRNTFGRAGLAELAIDEVQHQVSPNLVAYGQRLAYRAISTFEYLDDREIADGLNRLNNDAAAETTPLPVRHTHDLLTFEKQ